MDTNLNSIIHNTLEQFARNYNMARTDPERLKTDREAERFISVAVQGDYQEFDRCLLSYEIMRDSR